MCLDCDSPIPVELEVEGFVAVAGAVTRKAGSDALAAALMVPDAIPARGLALLVKASPAGPWALRRYLPEIGKAEVRREALELVAGGASVAIGEVAAVSRSTGEAVLSLERVLRPAVLGDLVAKSTAIAEELLERIGIRKADPVDPTTPAGFTQTVAAFAEELNRTGGKVASSFMSGLMDRIDVDWKKATDQRVKELTDAINTASTIAAGDAWVGMRGTIYTTDANVKDTTRQSMINAYNMSLGTSLSLRDAFAADHSLYHQAHYVRDFYTREVATGLSRNARQIVGQGISDGLGRTAIGAQLQSQLGGSLNGWTRNYFNTAASAMVGRSRTYSALVTMRDSGVTLYIITAVLDERTTETCRYLDGKVLNVEQGVRSFELVAAAENPRAVEYLQPWYREKTIKTGPDAGKLGLYLRQQDGQKLAAIVERSARGVRDGRGEYRPAGRGDLQNAEGPPPYHGLCRTIVIPDTTGPVSARARVPLQWTPGAPPVATPSSAGSARAGGRNAEDLARQASVVAELERLEQLPRFAEGTENRALIKEARAQIAATGLPLIQIGTKSGDGYFSLIAHNMPTPAHVVKMPEVVRLSAFMQAAPARAMGAIRGVVFAKEFDSGYKDPTIRGVPKDAEFFLSDRRVLTIKIGNLGPGELTDRIGRAVNYATRLYEGAYKKFLGFSAGVERVEAMRKFWEPKNDVRTMKASSALDSKRFDGKILSATIPQLAKWTRDELEGLKSSDPEAAAKELITVARSFIAERFDARYMKESAKLEMEAAREIKAEGSARWNSLSAERQREEATTRAKAELLRTLAREFVALHGPTAGSVPSVAGSNATEARWFNGLRATLGDTSGEKYVATGQATENVIRRAWAESVRGAVSHDLIKEAKPTRHYEFSTDSSNKRAYHWILGSTGARPRGEGSTIATPNATEYGLESLKRTFLHEYGHSIGRVGRTSQLADAFARSRWSGKYIDSGTAGNVKLTLTPDEVRIRIKQGQELALDAKFMDPYCARLYGGSAGPEVLSMGAEWLLQQKTAQALRFWQADPDHFAFTMAFLAGLAR